MKKCAIVIPYFGTEWPIWFPLYLYSLGKNKDILDVYFITNILPPSYAPDNAKFQICNFKEYSKKVSEKLNIQFVPESPYKLCDLKPFLPIIHADQLTQYDYVGFGDLDLIYGNLSKWLNKVGENKTVISTHIDRISGHFVLLKNTPRIINKAFYIPKWREILQDNKHHGIDEGRFSFVHFPLLWGISCVFQYKLKWRKFGKNICKPLNWLHPNIFLREMHTTPMPKSDEKWRYYNGEIFDPEGNEIPYLHFLFFKKTKYNPNNQQYWKDRFYKINIITDLENKGIIVDIDGISYE